MSLSGSRLDETEAVWPFMIDIAPRDIFTGQEDYHPDLEVDRGLVECSLD